MLDESTAVNRPVHTGQVVSGCITRGVCGHKERASGPGWARVGAAGLGVTAIQLAAADPKPAICSTDSARLTLLTGLMLAMAS